MAWPRQRRLLWAAYSVLTRRHAQGQNAVPLFLLATGALLWAWFGLSAATAALLAHRPGPGADPGRFAAASFSCWNHGVQHGNMGLLAALSYTTPVLSAALGSLWLGVTLTPAFWQGVACVSAGSLLCWWAPGTAPALRPALPGGRQPHSAATSSGTAVNRSASRP
jgi:drug/metabolite transporter (DMT)-like permease